MSMTEPSRTRGRPDRPASRNHTNHRNTNQTMAINPYPL